MEIIQDVVEGKEINHCMNSLEIVLVVLVISSAGMETALSPSPLLSNVFYLYALFLRSLCFTAPYFGFPPSLGGRQVYSPPCTALGLRLQDAGRVASLTLSRSAGRLGPAWGLLTSPF